MSEYTRDAVMILVVVAVILFAGYELLNHPDGDAGKLLLGPIIGAFIKIGDRLFSK